MLIGHVAGQKPVKLQDLTACSPLINAAFWIDARDLTTEEEDALERCLGFDVPTRAEMQEIEVSSRLYQEKDVLFMTVTVVSDATPTRPVSTPFTFVLLKDKLVTLRYGDPAPVETFREQLTQAPDWSRQPRKAFAKLVDIFIDQLADLLEEVGGQLDALSEEVFRGSAMPSPEHHRGERQDYQTVLRRLGCMSDLLSRVRESLLGFGRLSSFWADSQAMASENGESLHLAKTVAHDVASLSDHAQFLSGKLSFLLDATLGLINVEQNAIIKVFSILAVIFLPPTLIGTIYGMNFERMPELGWRFGYPLALCLMIASAVVPYLYFKRKGWY